MTDPDQLPALPESEYLLARPARPYENEYITSFDGYSDDDMRSYALTAIVAERARADALQAQLASLADTVAESVRNTCSMPHPDISLSTDLRPHIWSLSYEANNQQAKARRLSADAARADALEAALKPLAALGLYALDETRGDYIGSDLSGGDIQDKAEALGLLTRVEVKEPCSEEYCSCAEYYDKDEWPVQCLQNSPLIATARALLEKKT